MMKRKLKLYTVFQKQIDEAAEEVLEFARRSGAPHGAPIDVWIHLWAVQSMQKLLLHAAERPLVSSMDLYALRGRLGTRSRYFLQMIRELRTKFGVIDQRNESKNTLPRAGAESPKS